MTATDRVAARGRSVFVDSGPLRLHALRYDGPADREVVLLPGLTCPAVTLEFLALALAARWPVTTLDYRGRGLSDAPGAGYGLPDYAGDVGALIAQLELTRPVIVGQALGGRIAPAFDALFPGLAHGMVIIDPPLTGPGTAPYSTAIETFLAEIAESLGEDRVARVAARYPSWTPEQVRARAHWLSTCDERAIAETHAAFHTEDVVAYFRQLTAPSVFIYGEHSRAVASGGLDALRAAAPQMAQVMVPGSGHLVPFDDLPSTVREITGFIDGLDDRLEEDEHATV